MTLSYGNLILDTSGDIMYDTDNDNIVFTTPGIYGVSYITIGRASADPGTRTMLPIINDSGSANFSSVVEITNTGRDDFSISGSFFMNVTAANSTLSMLFTGDSQDMVTNGVVSIFRIA